DHAFAHWPFNKHNSTNTTGGKRTVTDFAQYADPQLLDDPRTTLLVLRAAEFSDDAETLDGLARSGVTLEVLRKIARNPATAAHTLEYLIDVHDPGLIFPVTHRTHLSAEVIYRIARPLTAPTAIRPTSSSPPADHATLL